MDLLAERTVTDLWSEQVAATPERLWLVFEAADGRVSSFTYSEFDDLIDRTARVLSEDVGVRSGDHVALHLRNGPWYLQTWFALLRVGAVAVHSNTTHTAREVRHTLDTGEATTAITQPEYVETIRDAREDTDVDRVVVTDGDGVDAESLSSLVERADAAPTGVDVAGSDVAQVLFTSGTTSDPKGVRHTGTNLLAAGERQAKHLALRRSDRNATALPLYHVNAQTSALATLTAGCTLVLFEDYQTEQFVAQCKTHRVTVTSLIGTQVRALLAKDAVDPENDLRVITFAINVSDEEKDAFEAAIGAPLLNGYGLSEAMSLVTQAPLNGDRRWPSVGRPVYDRDVFVLDEEGREVPAGEVGEIAVGGERGRTLFDGYIGLVDETEAAFTDEGLLLTGDYGRFDADGYLYFVDRKKNIIETRGENVSEREVEDVLTDHEAIDDAAVVGIPHEIYGQVVKAYVRGKPGVDLQESAVREHADRNLAEYKVPAEVEFVDEFPRTGVGKIEKKELRSDTRS